MVSLVGLDQAKAHLRVDDTAHDYDIESKVAQSSEIVMDYIKKSAIPDEWMANTSPPTYDVPALIQAATLLVLSELYESREAGIVNILSPAVMNLLERYRDPALA